MKKTILLGLSALFSLTSYAQLSVDSIGRTTFYPPTTTTLSNGSSAYTEGYSVSVDALAHGGILVTRDHQLDTYSTVPGYGIKVNYTSNLYEAVGISSTAYGNHYTGYGIKGCVGGGGYFGVGVFGGLINTTRGIGIYGSTNSVLNTYAVGNQPYAGYFYGDVRTTGTIYGTLATSSSVSSPSAGGTTTNLSEQTTRGGETVTEKLQQVDLLQMERVNQDGSLAANKVVERGTYVNEDGKEVETEEPIQTKLSAVSYGLAADQLQAVYPELVYEDADGNYSINYVEMVPLLVQSIRELKAEVTELKQQLGISDPAKPVLKTKGKTEDADNVTLALPDNGQEATLDVYDLSGKLLRTSTMNATSVADLSSYTHGLPTGTYAYSLTVNGKKQKARKVFVK